MNKGEDIIVCMRIFLPSLTRCDLDAQLNLSDKGIGDGGAAAIARVLASNNIATGLCVCVGVDARSSLASLAPAARPPLSSL